MAKEAPQALTEAGSHVAIARGYAEGRIIEEGEPVPAGIAVTDADGSGHWMAPAGAPEAEATAAE